MPITGGMASVDFLASFVALLAALSVASERLVEIVKGTVPWLNEQRRDTKQEGRRMATLQALAVIAGIVTAVLARPALKELLPDPWDKPTTFLALGLLTSGGSGFWNGLLSYVKNVKDLKKSEALKQKRNLTP